MALRQRNATFPGVSFPSSVVRSIIETASFRPASFAEVLMLRFVNAVARSSTMIWSIVCIPAAGRAGERVELAVSVGMRSSSSRRSVRAPVKARRGDQRCQFDKIAHQKQEVDQKAGNLEADEDDMAIPVETEIRREPNKHCRRGIEEKHERHDESDVQPLVAQNECVKRAAVFAGTVGDALADDLEIVDEHKPHDRSEDGDENKPEKRIRQPSEGEALDERAGEVKAA